jgi:hypothetical protein
VHCSFLEALLLKSLNLMCCLGGGCITVSRVGYCSGTFIS